MAASFDENSSNFLVCDFIKNFLNRCKFHLPLSFARLGIIGVYRGKFERKEARSREKMGVITVRKEERSVGKMSRMIRRIRLVVPCSMNQGKASGSIQAEREVKFTWKK